MNTNKQYSQKVNSILEQARLYSIGKIKLEEAKENITLEMLNIRPCQYEEFKSRLGEKLRTSINVEEVKKLMQVFDGYIPFPFKELTEGHPIRNYFEENIKMRNLLIEIDKTENQEVLIDYWIKIYDTMKNYELHIKRQEANLYVYLEKVGMIEEVRKAKSYGMKIIMELEKNINYLKKGDSFNFLFSQRDFMSDVMNYLELEERILFPGAVINLEEEDFITIKKDDDETGYSFVQKVLDFTPNGDKKKFEKLIKSNLEKNDVKQFETEHLILENLVSVMNQAILFLNFKGEVLSGMGDTLGFIKLAGISELNKFKISEELMLELIRAENNIIRAQEIGSEGKSFDVIYSIVKDEHMIPKGILMVVNITAE